MNKEGKLGIITNTDIVRSHIERSTPPRLNISADIRTVIWYRYQTERMKINIKTSTHTE